MIDNCTFAYCDGVNKKYNGECTLPGVEVRGKGKYFGNTIFLPFEENSNSGYYWTATQYAHLAEQFTVSAISHLTILFQTTLPPRSKAKWIVLINSLKGALPGSLLFV